MGVRDEPQIGRGQAVLLAGRRYTRKENGNLGSWQKRVFFFPLSHDIAGGRDKTERWPKLAVEVARIIGWDILEEEDVIVNNSIAV